MSKFKPSTLFASAIIAAGLAVSAVALPATAHTGTQTSTASTASTASKARKAACRKIVITGVRVGVREFAFTNADVLRVRDTGRTLTSCGVLRGNGSNGYADKCGRSGRNWYLVKIPATRNWLGQSLTQGYVPATCARVAG
ncbi:hypothetical protein AB0K05_21050 [Nonomuraea sp. NPDC049486]|uniref:SH3 domain-containing protein n=1 Tax=Nonomuraea harbinensis TaxID=1286938 RepID=A0ABW1BWA4_9ACTN|nr:hypothetical protein [Nonomuraea harbinensis]